MLNVPVMHVLFHVYKFVLFQIRFIFNKSLRERERASEREREPQRERESLREPQRESLRERERDHTESKTSSLGLKKPNCRVDQLAQTLLDDP